MLSIPSTPFNPMYTKAVTSSMDTEGPKERSRDATRTEGTKRNTITSPLLRLPAEIRSEIYEYVLCNRNIHIGIRRRQPLEDGGYPRGVGDSIKLMHAVCLCPRSFSEAYQMSLQPEPNTANYFDERGHLKPEHSKCDDVLQGYYADHKPCNAVLHDLQWREYMSFPGKECRCPFPCIHYFQYRKSMIEKYGEPPAGLEIKYASTKYSLSLLQVCRQVHKEAALLPYAGNTFAFQNRFDMDLFFGTVLSQEQRDAIQTLNVCIRSPVNPTLPSVLPPSLKTLECFIVSDEGDWWNDIRSWQGKFSSVRVVSGWDGRRSVYEEPRAVRREKAERLERFLTKSPRAESE